MDEMTEMLHALKPGEIQTRTLPDRAACQAYQDALGYRARRDGLQIKTGSVQERGAGAGITLYIMLRDESHNEKEEQGDF